MTEEEINKIDAWLKATGTTESRLGNLATANGYAVQRIREGTASINTLVAVLDYIEAHPAPKKRSVKT